MNSADFLYNYAKEYLQYNVKACLMIENWKDQDCLPIYHKYIGDYILLRNYQRKNNISDPKMMQSFKYLREERLNFVYNYLFDDVKKRLISKKGKIALEKLNILISRLKPLRSLTNIDFKYIFELRKIEEEEY